MVEPNKLNDFQEAVRKLLGNGSTLPKSPAIIYRTIQGEVIIIFPDSCATTIAEIFVRTEQTVIREHGSLSHFAFGSPPFPTMYYFLISPVGNVGGCGGDGGRRSYQWS